VTTYSQLVLRDEATDSYRIWRTSANRWEFIRTDQGWRVTHRTNRPLDGGGEARELLRAAVEPERTDRPSPDGPESPPRDLTDDSARVAPRRRTVRPWPRRDPRSASRRAPRGPPREPRAVRPARG